MRNLAKVGKPAVLADNEVNWLAEWLADKENKTKKYRYRHPDIKQTLKTETADKCIYCESKIGHNTPGDVEHKVPSTKNDKLHFTWSNLTVACTECNRRKNDYYETAIQFLDPYSEDVESMLIHMGPVVMWKTGNDRAEVALRTLELSNGTRISLIKRKIEKIGEIKNLIERYRLEPNGMLKALLKKELVGAMDKSAEYSGMVSEMIAVEV